MNQNASTMMSNSSEDESRKTKIVKEVVDDFGRLSFALETYVKLHQTQDHPELSWEALKAVRADIGCLSHSVEEFYMEGGPVNE